MYAPLAAVVTIGRAGYNLTRYLLVSWGREVHRRWHAREPQVGFGMRICLLLASIGLVGGAGACNQAPAPPPERPATVAVNPRFTPPLAPTTTAPAAESTEPTATERVPAVPAPEHRDRNHRDGELTGGYCARKWWC